METTTEIKDDVAAQAPAIDVQPTKSKTRGVLLFAFGAANYGQMASNLGWAIKSSSGFKIPVTLIATESAIKTLNTNCRTKHFNQIFIVSDEIHTYKGRKNFYVRPKCDMYSLSPYDDTIFMDVDTIWFPGKNINDLFNRLAAGKDDVMWQNSGVRNIKQLAEENGRIDYWVAARDVLNLFEWKRPFALQTHSYFIYFRKNETVKAYFDEVLRIHDYAADQIVLPDAERKFIFRDWRGTVPDELCFSMAYGTTGLDITDDMQDFKPLFQQDGSPKMEDCYKIAEKGFYGATLVTEKPCLDWVNNYGVAYQRHFNGVYNHTLGAARSQQRFIWKHKTR